MKKKNSNLLLTSKDRSSFAGKIAFSTLFIIIGIVLNLISLTPEYRSSGADVNVSIAAVILLGIGVSLITYVLHTFETHLWSNDLAQAAIKLKDEEDFRLEKQAIENERWEYIQEPNPVRAWAWWKKLLLASAILTGVAIMGVGIAELAGYIQPAEWYQKRIESRGGSLLVDRILIGSVQLFSGAFVIFISLLLTAVNRTKTTKIPKTYEEDWAEVITYVNKDDKAH